MILDESSKKEVIVNGMKKLELYGLVIKDSLLQPFLEINGPPHLFISGLLSLRKEMFYSLCYMPSGVCTFFALWSCATK